MTYIIHFQYKHNTKSWKITKFSDLAGIEADEAENWHVYAVFDAEHEFNNKSKILYVFEQKKSSQCAAKFEIRRATRAPPSTAKEKKSVET